MKSSVKKLAFILVTLLISFSVFAQETSEDDLFYINVPIITVYDHNDAYVVDYEKGSMEIGEAVFPKEWFNSLDVDKCRVRALPKGMTPYMTVIYKNSAFQKVYLNMPQSRNESSWKILSPNQDISAKLNSDRSTFKVEY